MMKKYLMALAAAAFLALTPALSSAGFLTLGDSFTLEELIAGQTLIAGDKLFSNFTYESSGNFPAAADINIANGVDSITGNFGIRITGGFLAFDQNSSGTIGYKVTVLAPGYFISDVHMSGNPDVVGGLGSMIVTESFTQDPTQLSIYDIDGVKQLTDGADLVGLYQSLNVTKQIDGTLNPNSTGFPTLSFIDQTFSQSLPEPGTIALLLTGALAVIPAYCVRRRKS